MRNEIIKVMGMTCEHCAQTVKKAVNDAGGVSQVDVDLEKKEVSVDFDENTTQLKTIVEKIVAVGYEVEE